jgi:hypothetical protein
MSNDLKTADGATGRIVRKSWSPKDIPGLEAWYSADEAGIRTDICGQKWIINRAKWSWWKTVLLWAGLRTNGAILLGNNQCRRKEPIK